MAKDSKHTFQQKVWLGISNLLKEPSSQNPDQPTNYWYSENLDVRTDPYAPTLGFATVKESGGIVTDFVKWADITPAALTVYSYGDTGNIYSRTSAGTWASLHQAPGSHGNGLQYFYGDDYLYYPTDTTLGRYGPLSGTPAFSDDFLVAQGGIPQNTYSLLLASASSQYATAADSATLSITSDLTLEAYFYLNSLPTVGNSMVLLGKWDESGTLRSYVMDIYGISGVFGDGSDGSLTISSNTTEAPIDSAATGTAGLYTLSATNASFVVGQQIFIHQTQGTNAGQGERNVISGYTAGTITLQTPLLGTYTTGAQVRTLPQYTNVTINSGKIYTAKAWNGTVGGILAFLANGTVTITGSITASSKGFRGGSTGSANGYAQQGEGTLGTGALTYTANGNGGGGGFIEGPNQVWGSGGGGGNGDTGATGIGNNMGVSGIGGTMSGSADLTSMTFGGGGGGGNSSGSVATGGIGGGIVLIIATTLIVSGSITSTGQDGTIGAFQSGVSGGGAGGSILLKAQTATLGTALITAAGGAGPTSNYGSIGGAGSVGRITLDYLTSYTGTTSPTLNPIQDDSLVTSISYQARLGISNNGTSFEYLTKNLPTLSIGQWNRLSIPWVASTSTATFYLNAAALGTTTGTKTAIHDNTSLLYVGAKKGASVVGSFLDGYIDDVRVWNMAQTASNIFLRNNIQLTGNEGGLAAYYKLNNAATDSTANANNLTLVNAPTYNILVPFVDPTTRLDIDQSFTTTGQDYDLLTAISELSVDSLVFTPTKDPQKSVDLNVGAKGTGNWTVTIHDTTNRVIATQTITNANMKAAGYQEFVWTTPWRIVIGKTYHMHVTSTVADGTVVSSVDDDFSTGDFHTYFQILVTDALFHPAARWLNFLVFGNERYLAKWDGAFYTPNLIAFPQGTHVRCFGTWGIYLSIGTWQEPSSGTPNVYDFATGKIYFWDGISLTFNFSIDVPEGQVNSIFGMDADLFYFAGWKGDLMNYKGSWANQSGSFNGTKIKRIPYLATKDYMEVYPQAMANYQGLLYMGLAANTNSTSLKQGVYSWGALYPGYPQSLVLDHLISTGNKGNTVRIGVVYPVGQKLLVSWADGIARGVDIIDPTSGTYHTSGLIQTNLFDGGDVWRQNLLLKVRADHSTLATGEGVQVGYSLERETTFETSNSITDTLKKYTTNTLSNGRANEFNLQALLSGNGTSTPTLYSLAAQVDELTSELAF